MSETELQRAILDALNLLPWCLAWRNSNAKKGKYRYGLHSKRHPTGSSDIVCCVRRYTTSGTIGQFVAIEVKLPGESLTPEQRKFSADVKTKGGVAVCLSSVPEAVTLVTKIGQGEWP